MGIHHQRHIHHKRSPPTVLLQSSSGQRQNLGANMALRAMAQGFHILMASNKKTHTHTHLGQHNKKGTCQAIQMPKLQYQWRNHQSPYGNLPTCTTTLEKS